MVVASDDSDLSFQIDQNPGPRYLLACKENQTHWALDPCEAPPSLNTHWYYCFLLNF